jgi:Bacterial PH domain
MLARVLAAHTGNLTGYRAGVTSAAGDPGRVFRLPALAYLAVLFLLFGVTPLALASGIEKLSRPTLSPRVVLFVLPILAIVFIARWATVVSTDGITVRAAFGSRRMRWDEIRGLSVTGTSVYAVLVDGSVRLPCVRVADLAEVSRASGGHLPEIADPRPKYAPQRRRRNQ